MICYVKWFDWRKSPEAMLLHYGQLEKEWLFCFGYDPIGYKHE